MLRAADGAAIDGEVWALPTAAIGALLAQVPPPLGFGTVELEDGPASASSRRPPAWRMRPDITRFGGWRAWLQANAETTGARRPSDRMNDSADLDAYIDAGTALLGIPVQPEWRHAIRLHLGISFNLGRVVLDFPLPDEADPAPVFAA